MNITAARTSKSVDICVDGKIVTTLTDKATIARPFVAVYTVGPRACHGHGLQKSCGCAAYRPVVSHGYGAESDCLCGRNFLTVRGLREHITKAVVR